MNLFKLTITCIVGLALAACGGSQAHAATNDLIANPADGRLYSFANALYIVQDSPAQFTIQYADGTAQPIADTNSKKFGALRSWSGFTLTWGVFTNAQGQLVWLNLGAFKQVTCNGGYVSTSTGLNFLDTPTCAQFNALKAAAN